MNAATPASAEEDVQRAAHAVHEYLPTVEKYHREAKLAGRAHRRAVASAYVAARNMKRPADLARHLAVQRTEDQEATADDAELLYQHALRELDALRTDVMVCQSVLRSVTATYAPLATGVGR